METILNDTNNDPNEPPFDREQYAGYLALQGLADSTIRRYCAMYVRWIDYATTHGHNPWHPNAAAVRAWSATIHGSRSVLAQARGVMLHLCAATEAPDVSSAIPVPRQPGRSRVALSREQTVQLLTSSYAYGLKGLAVRVGIYTAARRGEIAGMAWEGVDFGKRSITFYRPKVRDWHTVPLHPSLERDLADRAGEERWLFPGTYGGHVAPATIWEWVVEVGQAANVGRVTPHVLRRTALTLINDANPDLRAAMEVAGHTDPRVTAKYTFVTEDRKRSSIDSLPSFASDPGSVSQHRSDRAGGTSRS